MYLIFKTQTAFPPPAPSSLDERGFRASPMNMQKSFSNHIWLHRPPVYVSCIQMPFLRPSKVDGGAEART